MQPPHMVTPRPAGGGGDDADFASCNFAAKSTVFPSSWSSVHPHGIYHPYIHHHHHAHPHHQAHLPASDGRYVGVRPWMDPLSNHHVSSLAALHAGERPYGTMKADKVGQCEPLEAETRPVRTAEDEYACVASVDGPEKSSGERSGSELSSPGEHKEEKQQQQQHQLDPSEYSAKRIARC